MVYVLFSESFRRRLLGMRKWLSRLGAGSPSNLTTSSTYSTPSPNSHGSPSVERFFGQSPDVIPPPPTSPDSNPSNWNADFASNPTCWENLFDVYWEQVEALIEDFGEVTHSKVMCFWF